MENTGNKQSFQEAQDAWKTVRVSEQTRVCDNGCGVSMIVQNQGRPSEKVTFELTDLNDGDPLWGGEWEGCSGQREQPGPSPEARRTHYIQGQKEGQGGGYGGGGDLPVGDEVRW